jgi:hypothetical protein
MIENPVKWILHDDDRCGGDCGGNRGGNCGGMVMGGPHWHVGSTTGTIYHKVCGESLGAHLPDTVDPRGTRGK